MTHPYRENGTGWVDAVRRTAPYVIESDNLSHSAPPTRVVPVRGPFLAELIDVRLRLIDARAESEHVPPEFRCWVHDEVERVRALVREATE